MDDMPNEDFQREYMEQVTSKIAEFGHTYQHVFGGDDAPFTYTLGLTALGFPEVVTVGLPPETSQMVLAPVVDRVKAGEQFTNGQRLDDVLRGFPVMMLEVTDTSELRVAHVLAGPDRAVRAWQVVFPDAAGLWPWESGSRVAGQTIFGEPPQ